MSNGTTRQRGQEKDTGVNSERKGVEKDGGEREVRRVGGKRTVSGWLVGKDEWGGGNEVGKQGRGEKFVTY